MVRIMATQHSAIVGGSTAKRVINCPGSVALCAQMPPKPSSEHADKGTLCHNAIADILDKNLKPTDVLGMKYKNYTLDQAMLEEKILPALELLNQVDPDLTMDFVVESYVNFGNFLPGVFGSADVLGKIVRKAIVLDWKFGAGVIVSAEENEQAMFYASAAMRTPEVQWVFEDIDEIEVVIIQPPEIRRWTTTPARVKEFEQELAAAVREAEGPNPRLQHGEHCRWCQAKPICPKMTGAVDRALKLQVEKLDAAHIGGYLKNADLLEQWITDLRALAHQAMENGKEIPGWKLVAKRATRQWLNEQDAIKMFNEFNIDESEAMTSKIISPAQAEKVLKKHGKELPKELVVSISSGSTLALESDPRPKMLQIGQQLSEALSKLN